MKRIIYHKFANDFSSRLLGKSDSSKVQSTYSDILEGESGSFRVVSFSSVVHGGPKFQKFGMQFQLVFMYFKLICSMSILWRTCPL